MGVLPYLCAAANRGGRASSAARWSSGCAAPARIVTSLNPTSRNRPSSPLREGDLEMAREVVPAPVVTEDPVLP